MIRKFLSPFKILDFFLNRIFCLSFALLGAQLPLFLEEYLQKIIFLNQPQAHDFLNNAQILEATFLQKIIIFFKNLNFDLLKKTLNEFSLKIIFSLNFFIAALIGILLGSLFYFIIKKAILILLRKILLPEERKKPPLPFTRENDRY